MVDFDPYLLLRESLDRPLGPEETAALDAAQTEDPYFALLHFLQAKQSGSEQDRFKASIYASNRRLFRQYLEGKTYLPAVQKTMASHSAPKQSNRLATAFSILDFEPLCQNCSLEKGVFNMLEPAKRKLDHPLEDIIREKRAKYLHLGNHIRKEIATQKAAMKGETEIEKELNSRERDQALIDRFLAEPPKSKGRLHPMAKSEDEKPDPAAKSVEADEELVTETFARLYVLQNRIEDAIEIYKKLSLRFPQKSAYFDAQIEKIRTK
ncbi:MAG: hypothetical protein AAF927_26120 [Bacteroidota bacterium]